MYRVIKALNNNGVLAIDMELNQEVILLGNGIGFGKKVNERFEKKEDAKVYALKNAGERGDPLRIVKSVDPVYLEIANQIIIAAEKKFETLDNAVLLPLSDHIAFAIKRMQDGMDISNPFTNDIKALFRDEFDVALQGRDYIEEATGYTINDDEVGYITLHIHSALDGEKVAHVMQEAMLVRKCITKVEEELGILIDIDSLSYNRFSSHVRYMVARAIKGETISLDMNEYVKDRFPDVYKLAQDIKVMMAESLKRQIPDVEVGYLALHIERVAHIEE